MSDMNQDDDGFFVGYLPKMPAAYAAVSRRFVVVAGLAALAALGLAAVSQNRIDKGTYEFGVLRPFEGLLYNEPIPMLRTMDPKTGTVTNYVLVGATKAGVPGDVSAHSGKKVKFEGSLIQRGAQVMIELSAPGTFTVLGEPSAAETRSGAETLGRMTLRGEVVDTKCWFGAMRPALGKVHRGCAIRCLSGGVPPGLRVLDGAGHETTFLLAGRPGEPLDLDVQLAGLQVEVTGEVELQANTPFVRVESIARLESAEEP